MYLEVVFQDLLPLDEVEETEAYYLPQEDIDNEDFEFDEEALELTLPEEL